MGVLYFFFWGDSLGFEPIAPLGAAVLICNQEKMLNKRFFARLTTQGGDNARRTASKECPKRVYRATQHDYAMVAFLHLQEAKLACQAESVRIFRSFASGIPLSNDTRI